MREQPDKPALLDALAKFLLADLHPAVKDKKLAFRVLIAANLSATLATQLRPRAELRGARRADRGAGGEAEGGRPLRGGAAPDLLLPQAVAAAGAGRGQPHLRHL